jgi:hypothetical protein
LEFSNVDILNPSQENSLKHKSPTWDYDYVDMENVSQKGNQIDPMKRGRYPGPSSSSATSSWPDEEDHEYDVEEADPEASFGISSASSKSGASTNLGKQPYVRRRNTRYFSRTNLAQTCDVSTVRMGFDALKKNKALTKAISQPTKSSSIFSGSGDSIVLEGYGKILRFDQPVEPTNDHAIVTYKPKFQTDFMIPLPASVDIDKAASEEILPDGGTKVYDTDASKFNALALHMQRVLTTTARSSPCELQFWLCYDEALKQLIQLQRQASGSLIRLSSMDNELIDRRIAILQTAISNIRAEAQKLVGSFADCCRLEQLRRYLSVLHRLMISGIHGLEFVETSVTPESQWQLAIESSPLSFELRWGLLNAFQSDFSKSDVNHLMSSAHSIWKQFEADVLKQESTRKQLRAQKSRFQSSSASVAGGNKQSDIVLPPFLEYQQCCCKLDWLANQISMGFAAGNAERSIGTLQAAIELIVCPHSAGSSSMGSDSLQDGTRILADFEKYWDSGAVRIGDLHKSSDHTGVSHNGFDLTGGINAGYHAWIRNGRPDLANSDLFATSGDDAGSIVHAWLNQLAPIQVITIIESSKAPVKSFEVEEDDEMNTVPDINDIDYSVEELASAASQGSAGPVTSKRKRAADFFIDTPEYRDEEDSDESEEMGPQKPPAPYAAPKSSDLVVDENGYALVYSRVHGYRIPVKIAGEAVDQHNDGTQQDNEYKKILKELRGSADGSEVVEEVSR